MKQALAKLIQRVEHRLHPFFILLATVMLTGGPGLLHAAQKRLILEIHRASGEALSPTENDSIYETIREQMQMLLDSRKFRLLTQTELEKLMPRDERSELLKSFEPSYLLQRLDSHYLLLVGTGRDNDSKEVRVILQLFYSKNDAPIGSRLLNGKSIDNLLPQIAGGARYLVRDQGWIVPGGVLVDVDPQTAEVEFEPPDGGPPVKINPVRSAPLQLEPGDYRVTVSSPGFAPYETRVTVVSREDRKVEVKLTQLGMLKIECSIPGSHFFVTNLASGEDFPMSCSEVRELLPGRYRVHARVEGYKETAVEIEAASGDTVRFTPTLELLTGTLKVTATPDHATIQATKPDGGKILGRQPLLVEQAAPGGYQLSASARGYQTQVQSIDVTGGGEYPLHLELRPTWWKKSYRKIGVGMLVLGAASIGTGVIGYQIYDDTRNDYYGYKEAKDGDIDCNKPSFYHDDCQRLVGLQKGSVIGQFALGGVLGLTGGITIAFGPK